MICQLPAASCQGGTSASAKRQITNNKQTRLRPLRFREEQSKIYFAVAKQCVAYQAAYLGGATGGFGLWAGNREPARQIFFLGFLPCWVFPYLKQAATAQLTGTPAAAATLATAATLTTATLAGALAGTLAAAATLVDGAPASAPGNSMLLVP
jgi:hypothetical protein